MFCFKDIYFFINNEFRFLKDFSLVCKYYRNCFKLLIAFTVKVTIIINIQKQGYFSNKLLK